MSLSADRVLHGGVESTHQLLFYKSVSVLVKVSFFPLFNILLRANFDATFDAMECFHYCWGITNIVSEMGGKQLDIKLVKMIMLLFVLTRDEMTV
jgi:hypothetical protein